jgi:rod shape-determining protein MreB
VAAAIGAGLDIAEPVGNMVVDVGGGTTEVAVLSLGGMVVSESLRIGGYELDEAISGYIRRVHRIAIGQQTAEDIKIELGSAAPLGDELMTEVRGRDLTTGLPKEIHLTSEEVRTALGEPVEAIIGAIKDTLERTPPELASDISERGILLAGGGALLGAFADRVRDETGMPASLAESPLTCVAVGSGMSLEEFDAMARLDRPFERSATRRRLRPAARTAGRY